VAPRITALLVDDDARLGDLLQQYLGRNEIDVTVVGDGERALGALSERRFDVVLLDLMLPGADGLEICRQIRASPEFASVPVLMLTAKGDDVDRIVGLEIGADDYLAKPFNPRELLARIRAVLRRAQAASESKPKGDLFRAGDLEIHFGSREVWVRGEKQTLTHFEFELLSCLAKAAGRVLSRDHLMDVLKGESFETFDRSIDVHISKLRAKIEADPKSPRYIKTVRGAGYLFSKEG
jgi:DNA-binding response OmpR family regulator